MSDLDFFFDIPGGALVVRRGDDQSITLREDELARVTQNITTFQQSRRRFTAVFEQWRANRARLIAEAEGLVTRLQERQQAARANRQWVQAYRIGTLIEKAERRVKARRGEAVEP